MREKEQIEKLKRKRRSSKLDDELEEVIVKKEKLESGENIKGKGAPCVTKGLIYLNGKVQIINSDLSRNMNDAQPELEIVNSTKAKRTTSTSFKQVNHTEKWTDQETSKFYRVIIYCLASSDAFQGTCSFWN